MATLVGLTVKVSLPILDRVATGSIDGVMVEIPITRTPLGSKDTESPDTVIGGPPGRSVLWATSRVPEGPTVVMGCPATVANAEALVRGVVLPATTIPATPIDTGVPAILITDWPKLAVWLPMTTPDRIEAVERPKTRGEIGESFEFELDDPAGADVEIEVGGPEGSIKPARLAMLEGAGSGVALGNAGVIVVLCGSVIGVSPPAIGVKAEGGSRGPVAPTPGVHVDQAGCSSRTFNGRASIGEQGPHTPTTPSEAVAIPGIAVQFVPQSRKSI
ncbi:MAG: hypothetical protein Q9187_004036 [Circinaria calcarea]